METDIFVADNEAEPNEICPDCLSHNVYAHRYLVYAGTREEPPEYGYECGCFACGYTGDYLEEDDYDYTH